MSTRAEWPFLRGGLLVVAALLVAAVAGWRIHDATHDDPTAFELMTICLRYEKHLALEEPRDPVAESAELGAVRTVVETNGVTVAVAASEERALELVRSYRAVAGDLGPRLEQRGSTVYLWDRDPSPTQQQAVYDCTY